MEVSGQLHSPATLASMNMSWPGYWKTEKSFATAGNGTLDPVGHSPVWDCLVCEGEGSRLLRNVGIKCQQSAVLSNGCFAKCLSVGTLACNPP
jgi:hypothetical protein